MKGTPRAPWTPEQDKKLRSLVLSAKSVDTIAEVLNRTTFAVRRRANTLRLPLRKITRHLNDDKSPLIGLMNCIVCRQTMKIEKSSPDAEGKDIIQYRCGRCDRIERVQSSCAGLTAKSGKNSRWR
jgi:hypothetical protein